MTPDKLKHVSEVLGWLAEGKEVQYSTPFGWVDACPGPEDVLREVAAGTTYRRRPERLESSCTVSALGDGTPIVVLSDSFKQGDRVHVIKVDDAL